MRALRFVPKRYQLNKEATQIVMRGHPWIFRDQLSSAADVFRTGQWLQLMSHENAVLGFGIFEKAGLIGIRVLKRGKTPPTREWISKQVEKALGARRSLLEYTDAWRAIHGENDGLPGVVIDVYGTTGVLQTYSSAVDSLGRYVAAVVASRLGLKNLMWKLPVKRTREAGAEAGKAAPSRRLRGAIPEIVRFREGKMNFAVQLSGGQKSGTFLDLRGLRKWISLQKWGGKRVLNLFSYTGAIGLAAEHAGASEIWNVDIAQGALDFGSKYHVMSQEKHRWIQGDIFKWVAEIPAKEKFDVIIVDPPMVAGRMSQVPTALKAFRKIYRKLLGHRAKHTIFIACDCTSRIARKRFRLEMEESLGHGYRLGHEILPEDDHPVGFSEGDYLKMFVFTQSGGAPRTRPGDNFGHSRPRRPARKRARSSGK